MKVEKVTLQNFRCFGPQGTKITLKSAVTAFVGANGSGKTAAFQGLSRLFGVTPELGAYRTSRAFFTADLNNRVRRMPVSHFRNTAPA
jgi:predicted ATP-dependent endonuclease of OLD family